MVFEEMWYCRVNMSDFETKTNNQQFDPSQDSPFVSEARSAARRLEVPRTEPQLNEINSDTINRSKTTLTSKQKFGIATAIAVGVASGATGALTLENALNHTEPSVEQLHEQAISSTIIYPSPEDGNLISGAEIGFEELTSSFLIWNGETKSHDPFPVNINHERIVSESQEAQEEYTRITGQTVVPSGAQFKMYLLEKEDGTYDIEINPEVNNES